MPRCKICNTKFEPAYFLQKHCDTDDCKVKWAMQVVSQQKQKIAKEKKDAWTKEKLELKEKLKTLSEWSNDLQKEVNSIVRLIDNNHNCISSHRSLGKSFDAGHLYGRQSNPHIRYHLFNIFAQSVHDNQWKSGNPLDFIEGIEIVFGTETKDYCLSLKGLPDLKLSINEIKEKIPIARGIIKELKLQNRKFTTEERLTLRKKYNQLLGIYEK